MELAARSPGRAAATPPRRRALWVDRGAARLGARRWSVVGAAAERRFVGLIGLLLLCIAGLAALELWHTRRQAVAQGERAAATLAHVLAEQTARTIQAVDLTLLGLRDALAAAPGLPGDDARFRAAMRGRLEALRYVRALFVIGPDGFITHDTDHPATPRVSLADRPYFRFHEEHADPGLHVAEPLVSRSAGVWFVSLSRRIERPDGGFGGLVVAAVEPRYFERFYGGIDVDPTAWWPC